MYDPNDLDDSGEGGGYEPKPGTYDFKIDKVEERTFKTGSKGIMILLLVDGGGKYEDKCFVNVVTKGANGKGNTLWKLKQLLTAIGLPFDPPPAAYQLEGQLGKADFSTEKSPDGKYTNLIPDRFHPFESAIGEAGGQMVMPDWDKKEPASDEVPF